MAQACQRQHLVARAAEHVLRLPGSAASDARADVQRIQPAHPDELNGNGGRLRRSLVGGPEQEPKGAWPALFPSTPREVAMSTASAPHVAASASVISADSLLEHWLGHRRLSRRMIEAFPEVALFTFNVGGIRSFGALALEMLGMGAPFVRGVVTDTWEPFTTRELASREELLELWDESTERITALWAQIPAERFGETIKAFGQYEGTVSDLLLYVIDNEVHHRGQGYVYLRALGIEPPPFWERQ
jgi:uncharacterized damage-inducible protein DinB